MQQFVEHARALLRSRQAYLCYCTKEELEERRQVFERQKRPYKYEGTCRDRTEPVPGRFPTALGPLPLLRESRLNHLGKLMFQWVYWHALLPGRELPGLGPTMPTFGKKGVPVHAS